MTTKRYGWTHGSLIAYYTLRKAGYSPKTAARMALRGWHK